MYEYITVNSDISIITPHLHHNHTLPKAVIIEVLLMNIINIWRYTCIYIYIYIYTHAKTIVWISIMIWLYVDFIERYCYIYQIIDYHGFRSKKANVGFFILLLYYYIILWWYSFVFVFITNSKKYHNIIISS